MTTENNAPAPVPGTPPATPPAPAPVAPPATPPAPAPAPAEPLPTPDATADKDGTFTYAETGDRGLDMALSYFGKHKFGADHPAVVAAIDGDFSLLRAELASKQAPGYEAYIALAEKAYEKHSAENAAKRKADAEAVHAVVGGEEAWNEVKTWAAANADDGEKAALSEMLGKGGKHAVIAAGFLAAQYQRANGGAPSGPDTDGAGPKVAAVPGAAGPAANTALSPADYGKAVADARSKHNPRQGHFEDSDTYKQLRSRRAAWKG